MEKKYLILMKGLIQQINRLSEKLIIDFNNKDCNQIEIDIECLKFYLDLIKKINIQYGMATVKDMSYSIPVYKSSEYKDKIKRLAYILKKKETKRRNRNLLLSVSSLIISIIALIIVIL